MLHNTFEDIQKLDGVKASGSYTNQHPLFDENITILFHNGYRLISSKSVLGQTIELGSLYNPETEPSFTAHIYHENAMYPHIKNDIFKEQNGITHELSTDEFLNTIGTFVSKEVMEFLSKRHESIAFTVLYNNVGSTKMP